MDQLNDQLNAVSMSAQNYLEQARNQAVSRYRGCRGFCVWVLDLGFGFDLIMCGATLDSCFAIILVASTP